MYESYKLSDYRKFDKSNSIDIWKYSHEGMYFKFHQNFPSFSLPLDSPLKNPSLHLYPYVTYIRNTVRWQSKYFHAIRQMHAKIRVTAARKTFLAPGIALDDDAIRVQAKNFLLVKEMVGSTVSHLAFFT